MALQRFLLIAAGAAIAALAAVWSIGGSQERMAHRPLLVVSERDFRITAPAGVNQGQFQLHLSNRGPLTHELIIVRTKSSSLPLRSDGFTVDEDAVQKDEVGSLEGAQAGTVQQMSLRLSPGRYVLFCNMAGHYMAGMHTALVVR